MSKKMSKRVVDLSDREVATAFEKYFAGLYWLDMTYKYFEIKVKNGCRWWCCWTFRPGLHPQTQRPVYAAVLVRDDVSTGVRRLKFISVRYFSRRWMAKNRAFQWYCIRAKKQYRSLYKKKKVSPKVLKLLAKYRQQARPQDARTKKSEKQ